MRVDFISETSLLVAAHIPVNRFQNFIRFPSTAIHDVLIRHANRMPFWQAFAEGKYQPDLLFDLIFFGYSYIIETVELYLNGGAA